MGSRFEQFVARYEVLFGDFPISDDKIEQREIWSRFAGYIRQDLLDELFDAVNESRGGRMGKPRLGEFKRHYRQLDRARPRSDRAPPEQCAACGGDGWLSHVATYFSNVERERFADRAEAIPRMYEVGVQPGGRVCRAVIPCLCSAGERIMRQTTSRFDIGERRKAFEQWQQHVADATDQGVTVAMVIAKVLADSQATQARQIMAPLEPAGGPVDAPHQAGEPNGIEADADDPPF